MYIYTHMHHLLNFLFVSYFSSKAVLKQSTMSNYTDSFFYPASNLFFILGSIQITMEGLCGLEFKNTKTFV